MSGFTEFLKSKVFFKHFFLAVATAGLLITCILLWIRSYTEHGKSVEVPGLKGKNISNADLILSPLTLKIKVIDSLFQPGMKGGTIIDQNPGQGVKVKENRTIYVSINAYLPPMVAMPELKDASFRQARAILESIGLKVGDTTYTPDIARDAVLSYATKGRKLKAGERLNYGTAIDLSLGDGLTGEQIELPDLIGLSYTEVHNILNDLSLTAGSEIFDNSVSDSLQAKVVKQVPAPAENAKISKGSPIDLFYSQHEDSAK
jgi:beta-lactam-binding protein with PASTA domain